MPRRLQGLGETLPDLRTGLLDHELPFPAIASPIGSQGLIHEDAELVTAEGTGLPRAGNIVRTSYMVKQSQTVTDMNVATRGRARPRVSQWVSSPCCEFGTGVDLCQSAVIGVTLLGR
jgi:hypothetical protein